jgi:hypothetical protein
MDLTSSSVRCHSGLRQSELTPRASQLSGLRVMLSRHPCNMHSAAAEIRTRNRSATARMPRSISMGQKLPLESPTGRAVTHLLEKLHSHLAIIGVFHLIPNLAVWIAKACERAQDFGISELHRWQGRRLDSPELREELCSEDRPSTQCFSGLS